MKKSNSKFIASAVLFLMFLTLTAALCFIDVKAIGPNGSNVGLAGVNGFFKDLFGTSTLWYDITEIFGYVALASAGVFAIIGAYQLVTRKSLKKVDLDIYALAGLYVLVMAAYVFFEIFVINCRPILTEGELEASFPSSHTMIVLCFIGGAIHQIRRRVKSRPIRTALEITCVAVIFMTVLGRMICGVHWFTDIIGGVLLSLAIVFLYTAVVDLLDTRTN